MKGTNHTPTGCNSEYSNFRNSGVITVLLEGESHIYCLFFDILGKGVIVFQVVYESIDPAKLLKRKQWVIGSVVKSGFM